MDTFAIISLGQMCLKVTNALAYYFKAITRKEKNCTRPEKKVLSWQEHKCLTVRSTQVCCVLLITTKIKFSGEHTSLLRWVHLENSKKCLSLKRLCYNSTRLEARESECDKHTSLLHYTHYEHFIANVLGKDIFKKLSKITFLSKSSVLLP